MIAAEFPMADMARQGITGHSMGGHGALTTALRNPDRFRSVLAFAPIVAPLRCPWGEKALGGYLGQDRMAWRAYEACALIEDGARVTDMLVDRGEANGFLVEQLKPELLAEACGAAGIELTLRMQPGYGGPRRLARRGLGSVYWVNNNSSRSFSEGRVRYAVRDTCYAGDPSFRWVTYFG